MFACVNRLPLQTGRLQCMMQPGVLSRQPHLLASGCLTSRVHVAQCRGAASRPAPMLCRDVVSHAMRRAAASAETAHVRRHVAHSGQPDDVEMHSQQHTQPLQPYKSLSRLAAAAIAAVVLLAAPLAVSAIEASVKTSHKRSYVTLRRPLHSFHLCLLAEGICARMQTAAPSEVIAAAKSLPQQEVDKPKVWLLLAGGSAVLFGVTVFLEKQTQLFPAISKANQAMSQSRTARQVGRSAGPGTVHSLPIALILREQKTCVLHI